MECQKIKMALISSGYHHTISLQNNYKMSDDLNLDNTYEQIPANALLTLDFQSVKNIDIIHCKPDISKFFSNTFICRWHWLH